MVKYPAEIAKIQGASPHDLAEAISDDSMTEPEKLKMANAAIKQVSQRYPALTYDVVCAVIENGYRTFKKKQKRDPEGYKDKKYTLQETEGYYFLRISYNDLCNNSGIHHKDRQKLREYFANVQQNHENQIKCTIWRKDERSEKMLFADVTALEIIRWRDTFSEVKGRLPIDIEIRFHKEVFPFLADYEKGKGGKYIKLQKMLLPELNRIVQTQYKQVRYRVKKYKPLTDTRAHRGFMYITWIWSIGDQNRSKEKVITMSELRKGGFLGQQVNKKCYKLAMFFLGTCVSVIMNAERKTVQVDVEDDRIILQLPSIEVKKREMKRYVDHKIDAKINNKLNERKK